MWRNSLWWGSYQNLLQPLENGSRNNYGVSHVIQADSYVESSQYPSWKHIEDNEDIWALMEKVKSVTKVGWHPSGKDGKKESWRGDFKGINQVVH